MKRIKMKNKKQRKVKRKKLFLWHNTLLRKIMVLFLGIIIFQTTAAQEPVAAELHIDAPKDSIGAQYESQTETHPEKSLK